MFSKLNLVLVVIIFDAALAQLSFPVRFEMGKKKSNAQGRLPVYSPSKCKTFELLYPGDQGNDWICDCEPGAVYYPEADKCYPVFRRGPCPEGEFLVLGPNKIIPECILNACKHDGEVLINNICYTIGSKGPCPMPELSYVVGVNISTFTLDCVKLSIDLATRFGEEIEQLTTTTSTPRSLPSTIEKCARGSKRAIQGRCPE